jgi:hypothetical protein
MKARDLWKAIDILWAYMPVEQRLDIDREYPGLVELCRLAGWRIAPSWEKDRNDTQRDKERNGA